MYFNIQKYIYIYTRTSTVFAVEFTGRYLQRDVKKRHRVDQKRPMKRAIHDTNQRSKEILSMI